ncbi:MAG: endoglucanase [Candidatus Saccharibacteria bacterium]|jgi:endoglucanase|nr:endoglucanase [Candidatus Saccharibacteria bacterium]
MRNSKLRALSALGLAVVWLIVSGCGGSPPLNSDVPTTVPPVSPYYMDRDGVYQQQLEQSASQQADPADAATLRSLAGLSWATWWNNESDLDTEIKSLLTEAHAANQRALIVVYRIPDRDCGSYSASGASKDEAAYLAELSRFAAMVKTTGQPVDAVFEPDAIAHMGDSRHAECLARNPHRFDMVRKAVSILKSAPSIRVLLDAGNADWLPPTTMTPALMRSGLDLADGIAVNVSNFQWTNASVSYAQKIIDEMPDKLIMIDTSRNGLGPYRDGDANWAWCNPPDRALGPHTGSDTGHENVIYARIKLVGQSDGECARAAPPSGDTRGYKAGDFVPLYAWEIATNSKK